MTAQLTLDGDADLDLDSDEAKEGEVAYTPAPVVRQMLGAILHPGRTFDRVLDPCAGAGVFGVEVLRAMRCAYIVGVEPRFDERFPSAYCETHRLTIEEYARKWVRASMPSPTGKNRFDLIAGNPPFSLVLEFVETCRPMLTETGLLVLLLPSGWWQRGAGRWGWMFERTTDGALFQSWPNLPTQEMPIGGGVGFKGPGGKSDIRNYSWFVWTRHAVQLLPSHRPGWDVNPLPWLPGDERRWITPPGRE